MVALYPRHARSALWRHADYLRFWAPTSVSLAGDTVTRLALLLVAIAILDTTHLEIAATHSS